jgi:hypothetical protein
MLTRAEAVMINEARAPAMRATNQTGYINQMDRSEQQPWK